MTELYYSVNCMDAKTGADIGPTRLLGPVDRLSVLRRDIEGAINSTVPGVRAQATPLDPETRMISTLSPIKTFPIQTKNRIRFEFEGRKEIIYVPYMYQVHPETFYLTATYGQVVVANAPWNRSETLLHKAIISSLTNRIEIGKLYVHKTFIWATPVIIFKNYNNHQIIVGSFLSLKKERS